VLLAEHPASCTAGERGDGGAGMRKHTSADTDFFFFCATGAILAQRPSHLQDPVKKSKPMLAWPGAAAAQSTPNFLCAHSNAHNEAMRPTTFQPSLSSCPARLALKCDAPGKIATPGKNERQGVGFQRTAGLHPPGWSLDCLSTRLPPPPKRPAASCAERTKVLATFP
jgi:hypothetical protein